MWTLTRGIARAAVAAGVGTAAVVGSAVPVHAEVQAVANSCWVDLGDTVHPSNSVSVRAQGHCWSTSQFDFTTVDLEMWQGSNGVVYHRTAASLTQLSDATVEIPCASGTWTYVAHAWVGYHTAKHPATATAVETWNTPTMFSCK